jgi:hypothetical protein
MGLQQNICKGLSNSKHNVHRIGYMLNGLSKSICIKSSCIVFNTNMVSSDLVMGLLAKQYVPGTKLTLLAVSDIGPQSIEQDVCKKCYKK